MILKLYHHYTEFPVTFAYLIYMMSFLFINIMYGSSIEKHCELFLLEGPRISRMQLKILK